MAIDEARRFHSSNLSRVMSLGCRVNAFYSFVLESRFARENECSIYIEKGRNEGGILFSCTPLEVLTLQTYVKAHSPPSLGTFPNITLQVLTLILK